MEYTIARSNIAKAESYEDSWKTYTRLLNTQKDLESYKLDWNEIKVAFGY